MSYEDYTGKFITEEISDEKQEEYEEVEEAYEKEEPTV